MNYSKESKKDVCSKSLVGQTNLDRYVLLESPKKKVVYKVSKQISDIFQNKTYSKLFRLLNLIENQLTEPLDFTVELDYITLEAFKRSCEENTHGYMNLKNDLGPKTFDLLNDLSIRKTTISAETICDSYLCKSDLVNLRKYYTKHHDIVLDCFKKNYSSLALYDVLYKSKSPASFLDNIYKAIKNKNETKIRKDFASRLLVEYITEMAIYHSEKIREELSYQMCKINKDFNKLTDKELSTIDADRHLIIDQVYNLL